MSTVSTASEIPIATEERGVRGWLQRRPLLGYGLLAYGISFLLAIIMVIAVQFDALSLDSPLAAIVNQIAAFSPAIAAVIVIAVTQGRAELGKFFKSMVHWRISPIWYLFILFGLPLLMVLGSMAFGLLSFQNVAERWPLLFTAFLPGVAIRTLMTGLAEEPGWRGFALPRMQAKHGPLLGIFLLGMFWGFWHLPNAFFLGVPYFAWQIGASIVSGFVLAWVYNRTQGSLLLAMMLHAAQNSTASLVGGMLGITSREQFAMVADKYSLVYIVTSAVLILIVAFATRGRFGYQAKGDKTI